MCASAATDWWTWQEKINSCECRACDLFRQDCFTARPWKPMGEGGILFISEAPPEEGGFWAPRPVEDKLRHHLLDILADLGLPVPQNRHSCKALHSFLVGGFFLVQAIKWPLTRGFNQLGSEQQRTLIQHSVDRHLQWEVENVRPRGIVALGNAAWAACARLHHCQSAFPDGGVTTLRTQDFELRGMDGRAVLLNLTHLPVDQNMNRPQRAQEIREDVFRFLQRMGWNRSRNSG